MLRSWGMLVPGLLIAASACARGGGGDDAPLPANSPVRVEVTNKHALPIVVNAVGSGINHRMGTVHPGMSGLFVIPRNLVGSGDVELQAHPSASDQMYRSGPLLLSPGAIVVLVIAPQLFNSTATLRPRS